MQTRNAAVGTRGRSHARPAHAANTKPCWSGRRVCSFGLRCTVRVAPAAAAASVLPTNQLSGQDAAAALIYGIPRAEWLKLQAPTRYLGNEFGAVHKPWESARVRFALTYPEIYEVGASNLGHIILYTVLNSTEHVLCDRAYFPGTDMQALLRRHGKALFGVESRRPLNAFDTLGFSLAYELGCTNILEMLRLSNIPVSSKERQEAEDSPWDVSSGSHPLVFAGGPTATSNPEPFSDFFDFFALGDGEELLVEIGRCLDRCKLEKRSRQATLLELARHVEGVYVPQFYAMPSGFGGCVVPVVEGVPARVKRRVAAPDPFQQIGLVPLVSTVHDRMTVEIRRGCTRGCRFCQPGMLTRPARDVDPGKVVDAVADGLRKTGHTEFSLLSLSCSDYLALPAVGLEIKNRLQDESVSLSLPSQRVDRFDDNIAAVIGGSRKSGLTFAPEAGTQRLRDIINKGLTNEELLRGVKTAWNKGWKQVKLYFMIGLPGETDADVMGIPETIAWLQRECRDGRLHLAVNVTVSNFTPKPHTPFQWHSVSTAEFERKQSMLREAFADLKQVKVNFTSVRISAMEDFVGRGDRRVGRVVRRAWELGALNDSWWESEQSAYHAWVQAAQDVGMDWKYRQVEAGEWDVLEALGDGRFRKQGGGGRGRLDRGEMADARLDMPLPWDVVDTGVARWWLKADLQRALEAATVPDCSHSGQCSECGVCGDDFGHNLIAPPPPPPLFAGERKPDTHVAQRLRMRFSKGGDTVFVGHLDLMKLLVRACRRAALSLSASRSPYHALPQLFTALPLHLGATSSAELLELRLTRSVDPQTALNNLQAQLPAGLTLHEVTEVPVHKLDGSAVEGLQALLQDVEYYVLVAQVAGDGEAAGASAAVDLGAAVSRVLALPEYIISRPSRKVRGRVNQQDARALLRELELVAAPLTCALARAVPELAGLTALTTEHEGRAWGVVRYVSGKRADNNVLPPERVLEMLSSVSAASLRVEHIHRSRISVAAPRQAPMSQGAELALRNLLRWEGHMAAKAALGLGPWAHGIENRVDDTNVRI